MKQLKYILLFLVAPFVLGACSDDWGNDNPEMEHIYYFGPEVWGYDSSKTGNNNVVHYEVAQGKTVAIPMQFWSEFVRSYDVTSFYYVTIDPSSENALVNGVDYEVVNASGSKISPNASGAYEMFWPQAKKGVQNVYIRALNGSKGSFYLQTFNPNSGLTLTNQDVSSTIQNKTDNYEVRIFTQNYRIKINIE